MVRDQQVLRAGLQGRQTPRCRCRRAHIPPRTQSPPPLSFSLLPPLFLYFRRRNFLPVCLVLRPSARRFKARESSLEMCDITASPGQWRLGRAITQATPPPPPPLALLRSAASFTVWTDDVMLFQSGGSRQQQRCRRSSERLWPRRSKQVAAIDPPHHQSLRRCSQKRKKKVPLSLEETVDESPGWALPWR